MKKAFLDPILEQKLLIPENLQIIIQKILGMFKILQYR